MKALELIDIVNSGETSHVQFKREVKPRQADDIVAEMVAMSNYEGGFIIIGVDDKTGNIVGLDFEKLQQANDLVFNWASNNVKPAITIFTETVTIQEKKVLVVNIPIGIDKPYCDKNMIYWIKSAANKRRVLPEELKRLYQSAGKLYAERELIQDTDIFDIDNNMFKEFYENRYDEPLNQNEIERVLNNLRLAKENRLTLAGSLLFGKNNEILLPDFYVSAIWFWGKDFIVDEYRKSVNITGNLKSQYEKALDFVLGTLEMVQGNKNFNSLGTPEIPKVVFEELLINAFVHRDYFINDSIKLFVFQDRIEIKSPGKLPNNLNIDDIKQGIQRRSRNVIITSFAIDLLPYRGVGSGILKSLKAYPNIDFENNAQAEFFKVIIYRPKIQISKSV